MLVLTISDRKKPTPVTYTGSTYTGAVTPVNLAIYNEAKRRDGIIKKLIKECPYREGDIVQSIKPEEGDIRVIRMCKEYIHMGKDEEWPKGDNPFLVTAQSIQKGTIFNCTVNYLNPKT